MYIADICYHISWAKKIEYGNCYINQIKIYWHCNYPFCCESQCQGIIVLISYSFKCLVTGCNCKQSKKYVSIIYWGHKCVVSIVKNKTRIKTQKTSGWRFADNIFDKHHGKCSYWQNFIKNIFIKIIYLP